MMSGETVFLYEIEIKIFYATLQAEKQRSRIKQIRMKHEGQAQAVSWTGSVTVRS